MQKTPIGQITSKTEQAGDIMTLQQIKQSLLQTSFGDFLRDQMCISEPIPLPTPAGLIENFFVFLVNKQEKTCSAPIARIGLFPEKQEIAYFIPCTDKPFSKKPEEILPFSIDDENVRVLYPKYEMLYNTVRPLFFHECSPQESALVDEYLQALIAITDPALFPFYIEMAPVFFLWLKLKKEIQSTSADDNQIENKAKQFLNATEKSIE